MAFILKTRWDKVASNDRKQFAHICPDFVIELLSESDHESALQNKMKEWMDNGCRLAWMINPIKKETTIYRGNGETETKAFLDALNGEDVLPGFTPKLAEILTEDSSL